MKTLFTSLFLAILLLPDLASGATPAGWFLAGNDPKSYRVERDATVARDGKPSALLASTKVSSGFGTMMQSFEPDDYRGKRLRMSAWVKAQEVTQWAGLWMRVDGENRAMLAFDNMQTRPITGTRNWSRHEVVLDVPPAATSISMGILLVGEGSVWINDVRLDIVDKSVPVTGNGNAMGQNRKPTNLDFEKN